MAEFQMVTIKKTIMIVNAILRNDLFWAERRAIAKKTMEPTINLYAANQYSPCARMIEAGIKLPSIATPRVNPSQVVSRSVAFRVSSSRSRDRQSIIASRGELAAALLRASSIMAAAIPITAIKKCASATSNHLLLCEPSRD